MKIEIPKSVERSPIVGMSACWVHIQTKRAHGVEYITIESEKREIPKSRKAI